MGSCHELLVTACSHGNPRAIAIAFVIVIITVLILGAISSLFFALLYLCGRSFR